MLTIRARHLDAGADGCGECKTFSRDAHHYTIVPRNERPTGSRRRKRDSVSFDFGQFEVDRYPLEFDSDASATDANFSIDFAVFVRHVQRHLGRPYRGSHPDGAAAIPGIDPVV